MPKTLPSGTKFQNKKSSVRSIPIPDSLAPFGIKIGRVSKSEDDRMHEVCSHAHPCNRTLICLRCMPHVQYHVVS